MNDERPTHLDLFSGIGGFALAAEWAGFRTVGFCEIEPYARCVIGQNFGAVENTCGGVRDSGSASIAGRESRPALAHHAGAPIIHDNIFTLDGTGYRGVSLVTGGFPCQPFSVAGKRRGAADDRHLWPEMLRVIDQARPAWVLGENVPGIIPMELDNVLSDLERIGYACRPFVIPACAVDARHRRDRLWVVGRDLANASGGRFGESGEGKIQLARGTEVERGGDDVAHDEKRRRRSRHPENGSCDHESGRPQGANRGCGGNVSDTIGERGRGRNPEWEHAGDARELPGSSRHDAGGVALWLPEPNVGRVAHGVPARVHRLKGLGNAIVPQVAYEILREIRRCLVA